MFRVIKNRWYKEKVKKLNGKYARQIERFEKELKLKPFSGKPLGSQFIREKKFNGYRLLFVVYSEHRAVLLVTITNKKAQSRDIKFIRKNLALLSKLIKTKLHQSRP